MAGSEGFRRIYLVGKAILAFGVLLDVILLVGFVVAALGGDNSLLTIGALGLPPTFLGLAVLLVAWIAEGFVNGRHSAGAAQAPAKSDGPMLR